MNLNNIQGRITVRVPESSNTELKSCLKNNCPLKYSRRGGCYIKSEWEDKISAKKKEKKNRVKNY